MTIQTEEEYFKVLERVEELFDDRHAAGSSDTDIFLLMTEALEVYEEQHFSLK